MRIVAADDAGYLAPEGEDQSVRPLPSSGATAREGRVSILYINLERSSDRRMAMNDQFRALSLSAARIEAIDGRELSPDQVARCDQDARRRRRDTALTSNEIGCFLSHRRAWETIARSGKSTLVLEDDVALSDDLPDLLRRLSADPPAPHFIRMGGNRRRRSLFAGELSERYEIRLLLSGCSGSHAYWLTPAGARALLAASGRFVEAVDVFLDHYWNSRGIMYAVQPWPVELRDDASSSTIGDERFRLECSLRRSETMFAGLMRWCLRQRRSLIRRWWSAKTCVAWSAKHGGRSLKPMGGLWPRPLSTRRWTRVG